MNRKLLAIFITAVIGPIAATPAVAMRLTALDFDTAPDGTPLNPYLLDGRKGQIIGGIRYSTIQGNVGQIWNSIGIDITVRSHRGNSPVGLFNSNCAPSGGHSLDGFIQPCEKKGKGDNDLATGQGYNPYGEAIINPSDPPSQQYNYDTAPQGNVLIIEEKAGNKIPDDVADGGIIRFDFNRNANNGAALRSVLLDKIGILDDGNGQIRVKFLNEASLFTQAITNHQENELRFYEIDPTRQVEYLEVDLRNSGAVTGLHFADFKQKVPTPALLPGLIGMGITALRKRKAETDATS